MSAQTTPKGLDADLLQNACACPFCRCEQLRIVDLWDEDGGHTLIECVLCKGSAPAGVWNRRSGAGYSLVQKITDVTAEWGDVKRRKQ